MDAPRAAPYAAQTPAVEKPDRQRTPRAGAHRRTVELPRATAAEPAGRGHLGRLHRPAETFALYAARRKDDRRAHHRNFRRRIRRRRAGRPGCEHPPVRPALGHRFPHRKPCAGADRHDRRREERDARRTGTGRQKPLHRRPRGRHRDRRTPHRLGQNPQRRTNLHRARLFADPPFAARPVYGSLRPRPAKTPRRQRTAKSLLRPAGQRPRLRTRSGLPHTGENPDRRPHGRRRPLHRTDIAHRHGPRIARCRRRFSVPCCR